MKKPNIKKIDNSWMRYVNNTIAKKFGSDNILKPSELSMLIFGSERYKVLGFGKGAWDSLMVAVWSLPGDIKKPFLYLKRLANDEEFINNCHKKAHTVPPPDGVHSIRSLFK